MKNNNLSEGFFKPTKAKIIISVIFLLLSLGALYLLFSINLYIEKGNEGSFISNPIFWILLFPILSIIFLKNSLINGWIIVFLLILLQALYIYIISCVIVWIYNKIIRK